MELDSHPTRWLLFSLFLLSAASLTFEINLTRLFSVSQFYHFAFMIVSLALLGYGASGTLLALFPRLATGHPHHTFTWLALGCGGSMLASYLLINLVPFDSFSIAWDKRQVWVLVLQYLALALPFFFAGLATGMLLATDPMGVRNTYAINLFGSATGCALALMAPSRLGGEGTVTLCIGLCVLAAGFNAWNGWTFGHDPHILARIQIILVPILICLLLLFALFDMVSRLSGQPVFSFMELRISPYKSLSYALQYPEAELTFQHWNAFSRVDMVRSAGIRSLPGLSYRYQQALPAQDGLLIDADDLSPIVLAGEDMTFSEYMPAAIAFSLHPAAKTLLLDSRGGLDIVIALENGAQQVTAVESNPRVVQAADHIYHQPKVNVIMDTTRSYLRRSTEQFDIVQLSLTSTYHPVRSGAYSLAEDYRYTVESFQDALAHLQPGGILVVTRWLQTPPSESLKAFALAVTALETKDLDPGQRIVAFRGYNLACLLIKNEPFTSPELSTTRQFTNQHSFDLTYAPDIRAEETNQYNVLPTSIYYQTFTSLLQASSRQEFYDAYPHDIQPPTDDRPFFGHYFKWSQTQQILAEMGKSWQPFGGAGYFVILALLILATLCSLGLILLPAFVSLIHKRKSQAIQTSQDTVRFILYFIFIGFAYLLIEIPLMQQFILYLGQPVYATSMVLFSLLVFSSLGSWRGGHFSLAITLAILVLLLLAAPIFLPKIFQLTLGLPLGWRFFISALVLAPLGFLMGMPFPGGLAWIAQSPQQVYLTGWLWGVNGAASVVSAVLAALIAMTFGFNWVLRGGALCYLLAWLLVMGLGRSSFAQRHPR
jgi:hypothetical protein